MEARFEIITDFTKLKEGDQIIGVYTLDDGETIHTVKGIFDFQKVARWVHLKDDKGNFAFQSLVRIKLIE